MTSLQVRMILEILGRPAEHVEKALADLVQRISSEKGVKLIEKQLHSPVPVPNVKDLYTTFAEVTLELESLPTYLGLLFAYMPAHCELISPEKIVIDNQALNHIGNQLLQRLHNYDAITKKVLVERDMLLKQLKEKVPEKKTKKKAVKKSKKN